MSKTHASRPSGMNSRTHHRTKGANKQSVTPQPERVKRESPPPHAERGQMTHRPLGRAASAS